MVGATGIEPVTPSMSTRCLKPNTLGLLEFLKAFVAFFAVCSRCIVAVRCRERLSFSEATAAISDGTPQPRAQKVLVIRSVPFLRAVLAPFHPLHKRLAPFDFCSGPFWFYGVPP
jgi:hypothetical protein